jgi:putative ABC transport system permease protein
MTAVGRGIRNAFRNTVRTISVVAILGLSIGLGFVMLTAYHSVTGQVAATLSSIGNTVTVGPPGYAAGMPLGKNLTTGELAPIARLRGVTGIDESLSGSAQTRGATTKFPKGVQVHVTPGGSGSKLGSTSLQSPESLGARRVGLACAPKPCTPPVFGPQPVYFSGSTQPANPVTIGASTLRIVTGHAISGTSSADDAMLSMAMARKNGLKVGSTFTAFGHTMTVAALFETDNQSADNTVVTSLPELQRLTGHPGQVETAVVTVASLGQLAATTKAIERVLGPRASVVSDQADASQAIGDLDSVTSIALYSVIGATGAAVVILLLVMVMIVRERKREIGILKAIGGSNRAIMTQFTTEAVTFTLLGLVVGLVAGLIAARPVTSTLVSSSGASSAAGGAGLFRAPSPFLTHLTDISAQVGWGVILGALAATLVIAVLASAASTAMIGRIGPAEVLRSE